MSAMEESVAKAIGSQPNPATVIRARCPVCKRVQYVEDAIGKRCAQVDDRSGRRCVGIYEGTITAEKATEFNVDGSMVIAFSNAVRELADIFEAMNVLSVKEMFVMGQKCASVEAILERQKQWQTILTAIAKCIEEKMDQIEKSKNSANLAGTALLKITELTHKWEKQMPVLERLVELCDRLQAHRESGLLDAVTKLIGKEPTHAESDRPGSSV